MSKIIKRFCAYILDILIVMLITQSLASTTIFNPKLNSYQKYNKQYIKEYQKYITIIYDIQKDYEDKSLTTEEYNKLIENHPDYEKKLKKYYSNDKLTKKNYNKLIKELGKDYEKSSSKIYYLIEKNSIYEFIIYLIVTFLYFVGFNYLTNGQTLGKKITKLKIVSQDDNKKAVPITSYIIRTVLMYQTIYYLVRLISIPFLSQSKYISVTSTAYSIQNILDFIIITFILIRKDGYGLHDILAKTKVVKAQKKKNEE